MTERDELTGRPQDQGRKRQRSRRSVRGDALLERVQAAMRTEVARLIDELEAVRVGLMPDAPAELVIDKPAERSARWDLVVKLSRELGAAIDPDPLTTDGPPAPARRARKPDYG